MYVNYAPYGNAGHILDYLRKTFDNLVYVCFNFHPVERSNYNLVEIYRGGDLVKSISLFTPRAPKSHVHAFAPMLSLVAALELVAVSIYVFLKFKIKPRIFFAPNAFLIFIGVLLRAVSLVDKVVFWVWDYYPTPKAGLYRKLFYRLYWALDKWCTYKSDFVWYLNERLLEVREKFGVVSKKDKQCVAPLGIDSIDNSAAAAVRQNTLGFVGVLKKHQGLELLLNSLRELVSTIPDIRIEVIGSGPEEKYFKAMAEQSPEGHRVSFRGFIRDEREMKKLIASWAAAAAPYVPLEGNPSAYADPSKVKLYLGCGTPVIITEVPMLAKEIHQKEAGIAIGYSTEELVSAVATIFGENNRYRENAVCLAHEYVYTKIYENAFSVTAKRLWQDNK